MPLWHATCGVGGESAKDISLESIEFKPAPEMQYFEYKQAKSGGILHNHVALHFSIDTAFTLFGSDLRELQPPTQNPKTSRKYNRPSLQPTLQEIPRLFMSHFVS